MGGAQIKAFLHDLPPVSSKSKKIRKSERQETSGRGLNKNLPTWPPSNLKRNKEEIASGPGLNKSLPT